MSATRQFLFIAIVFLLFPSSLRQFIAAAANDKINDNVKIFGGVAADISSVPFLLSLRYRATHFCAANAITPFWSVTAAHCLHTYPPPSSISVRVGSTNRISGGTILPIERYHIHPKYDRILIRYDVAVLRTTTAMPIPRFAILPSVNASYLTGTKVTVMGWGNTENGTLALNLLQVQIPIVSGFRCKLAWWQYYTETSLCAGRVNKDSCTGDSGGGLWLNKTILVGVVSFGSEKCGSRKPGVYTKISHPDVLNFVKNTTGIN
ncbi:trypsin 3A1-like [Culicoides brevitarsis]|uniref:trypsin 3A1-like n=1 Tax=Culicoides brevitarsis TaxID=469753 RepID=UPI00307B4F21